ncbi:MAG TPA: hypothetical protein VF458_02535 [Ktedonobacteraceae bacterium]
MRRPDEEDDDWDALGDAGDDAQEELLETRKRSLLYRISRQRAVYFADIQDGEGSEEEELADSLYTKGAGGFMSRVGAPAAGQKPVNQSPQTSEFADLSTWCCDVFGPPHPSALVQACSHQTAQDERCLAATVDQPTLLMPALTPKSMHIADQPTEPLLVVLSRSKVRGEKKPGILICLCPGFLLAWLHRLKPGPRARQTPAARIEKRAKQISAKGKKKLTAAHDKARQQIASQKEHQVAAHKKERRIARSEKDQQRAAALKKEQQSQSAEERAACVENAKAKDKGKAEKNASQEVAGSDHGKRARLDKGSQILLERLREREERGDMPRTLTPPVLRPARIRRPPTDSLFGK